MSTLKELVLTLAFLVLYIPLTLIIWYETNGSLLQLLLYLLGAKVIILTYLVGVLIIHKARRNKYRLPKTNISFDEEVTDIEEELAEEVEEEPEKYFPDDSDEMIGFRKLFSHDKHKGGEVI